MLSANGTSYELHFVKEADLKQRSYNRCLVHCISSLHVAISMRLLFVWLVVCNRRLSPFLFCVYLGGYVIKTNTQCCFYYFSNAS